MAESDVVRALTPVVAALEQLGVAYQVGGSIATSAWGVPRSTLDVDIVAQLELAHAQPLADTLQAHYYVDVEMIREAVRLRRSFNVIHLPTMLKVDVFVLKTRDFDRQAFARGVSDRLEEGEDARTFVLASPEDMILYKLEWFRLGGEVSDRQWQDVLGVLKVRAGTLDTAHLDRWAARLGLTALLDRALRQAGYDAGASD